MQIESIKQGTEQQKKANINFEKYSWQCWKSETSSSFLIKTYSDVFVYQSRFKKKFNTKKLPKTIDLISEKIKLIISADIMQ